MKYLIAVYGSQRDYDEPASDEAATSRLGAAISEFLATFTGALAESGELVDTQGLTAPVLARRVTLRDGTQVVTDGPFAETEEVLAGYWIVDCAGIDRATEIAARINRCPGRVAEAGAVIRPLMDDAADLEHRPAP